MLDLRGQDCAGVLRAGLLLLVAVGVAGSALALAYERHWQSAWQLAPWITLAVVVVGMAAVAVRPTGTMIWIARVAGIVAIVSSAIGVWQHFDANYNPGAHAGHDHGTTAPAEDDGHHHDEDASDDDGHYHDEDASDDDGHYHDEDASDDDGHHHDEDASDDDGHHHDEDASDDDGHHHDEDASDDDGHHHDEDASDDDGHHHDEDASDDDGHHHDEDERGDEMASDILAKPSFGDVVSGAEGHAPLPAALAIAPVGLALLLATLGAGRGRSRQSDASVEEADWGQG